MLAGKLNLKQINDFVRQRDHVYVETKFDGERIQCHFQDQVIMYFSRNSNDVTQIYGPKLTSHMKEAIDQNVQACVLDGEIIVWDNELGKAAPFGQNKAVAN